MNSKGPFTKLIIVSLFSIITILLYGNTASASSTPQIDNQIEIQSSSKYVTATKNWSKSYSVPPAKYFYYTTINGFKYKGSLNRFSYADADVRWIATYKGYVYPY
ncbi:hypothetical protein [Alkalicoccobacillus plakortidis]|uniref:Uncharacterized protein n=1 Tax=Alkalicoccobacillus plakortidis TaxID=444060 RepID=A0ABT0XND0_9BACI|nr:hypothetical protein [Alkalicoccobacillus plakortidis]MCM2677332.1 hypothetical protein [Alkalicoccobacillus plakortidis]